MGTILFEMLTGALPFAGTNFAEYLSAMLVDEPRAPQSVYADFPVEAEPVLRQGPGQESRPALSERDGNAGRLAALPGYDAQQERLSLLASTIEVRGFAAGDLGQALSRPGRLAGDESTPSQLADESTAVTGTRLWRWGVVGRGRAGRAGRGARACWCASRARCLRLRRRLRPSLRRPRRSHRHPCPVRRLWFPSRLLRTSRRRPQARRRTTKRSPRRQAERSSRRSRGLELPNGQRRKTFPWGQPLPRPR
jgi:hypothetical protein